MGRLDNLGDFRPVDRIHHHILLPAQIQQTRRVKMVDLGNRFELHSDNNWHLSFVLPLSAGSSLTLSDASLNQNGEALAI
jgi:hypothetical protein